MSYNRGMDTGTLESSDVRAAVENAWRAVDAVEAALAAGEIDEPEWYRRMQALIVPAYLSAANPRAQSGHSGDEAGWREARGDVALAIDRDGTWLDVGCASGHLMETAQGWAAERGRRIEPYGLDLSAELVALAARRLPHWRERLWVGNGLEWQPPFRFDFVHLQELSYVPPARRRELVRHLRDEVCAPGGRLIIGPFNEPRNDPETERALCKWGYAPSGRAARPHRHPEVERRTYWLDAPSEEAK